MKKVNFLLLSLFLLLTFNSKIYAICESEEMNKWVDEAHIEAIEDVNMDIYDDNGNFVGVHEKKYHYLLMIYPSRKDVYAKVTDSLTEGEYDALYDDTFYTITVGSYTHNTKKKYTIILYGSEDSACPGEILKTLTYEANPYNKYMTYTYCEENPFDDACTFNADTGTWTEDEFFKYVEDQEKKDELKNMSFFPKCWYYIKNYWFYVVIPVVLISIFYLITIIIEKNKKKVK